MEGRFEIVYYNWSLGNVKKIYPFSTPKLFNLTLSEIFSRINFCQANQTKIYLYVRSEGVKMYTPPAGAVNDLQDLEGEVWASCSEFDGYYEVSNLGRINMKR